MSDLLEMLETLFGETDVTVTMFNSLSTIAAYVFLGLALTALCRASGKGSVWMAWVPFASLYLLGLMADIYTDSRFPFGAPSRLRRKLLGFSIAEAACGVAAATALLIFAASGILAFIMALGGGFSEENIHSTDTEALTGMFVAGLLVFLAAGAVWAVFAILRLVNHCKAHYRVFALLDINRPALWTFLGILVPPLSAVLLFAYTRNTSRLNACFYPPAEDTAEERGEDSAHKGGPTEPPAPELYYI
jgi:hypothetical protein